MGDGCRVGCGGGADSRPPRSESQQGGRRGSVPFCGEVRRSAPMSHGAPNSCQGAVFPFHYSGVPAPRFDDALSSPSGANDVALRCGLCVAHSRSFRPVPRSRHGRRVAPVAPQAPPERCPHGQRTERHRQHQQRHTQLGRCELHWWRAPWPATRSTATTPSRAPQLLSVQAAAASSRDLRSASWCWPAFSWRPLQGDPFSVTASLYEPCSTEDAGGGCKPQECDTRSICGVFRALPGTR